MISNLHTHTVRCGHASGTEREFIEAALERGLTTLGFSDHAPMLFPGDYYSDRIRMRPEELEDYVTTLQALREEYKNQIRILIGLEMEYYPELFEKTLDFYRGFPLDYLILGQHYLHNEYDYEGHVMLGFSDPKDLRQYVDQVITGMEQGCFTFLAHPDSFKFTGSAEDYDREMRRICVCAKELALPMEINMYGVIKGGHYPNEQFWQIAAEVGNDVLVSLDAHRLEMFRNETALAAAYAMAERCGLKPIELTEVRNPFKVLSV